MGIAERRNGSGFCNPCFGCRTIRPFSREAVERGVQNPLSGTVFCGHRGSCTTGLAVDVNVDRKDRLERYPELIWREGTRQAIQEEVGTLEVMDELSSESVQTDTDVQEIVDTISGREREHLDEESASNDE
ncbi:MAG: hypothetical protein ACOCUO_00840 [archaeon]